MSNIRRFALTPGFSRVMNDVNEGEPFQRLTGRGEKTVKTVSTFSPSITGLKPGVNERCNQ